MQANARWKVAQKIEIKWWKRYLKNRPKADYLKWKKNYWTEFIAKLKPELKLNANSEVLDAGCGPAGVFIVLDDHKVTALDPLLDKYESELDHFIQEDYPNTEFITAPLEELNSNEKFDTVFCLNAINHVSDIGLAYDKLVNSVRPGGQIVVSIDAHNKGFFKRIFRFTQGDILHPHQYDLDEYTEFLTDRGVEVLKTVKVKSAFFFNYYVQVGVKI